MSAVSRLYLGYISHQELLERELSRGDRRDVGDGVGVIEHAVAEELLPYKEGGYQIRKVVAHMSRISRPYLDRISTVSRLYLGHISRLLELDVSRRKEGLIELLEDLLPVPLAQRGVAQVGDHRQSLLEILHLPN